MRECGVPARPKSKRRNFDSAVALFTERLFYSESLLVSALIKITFLVENPSRHGRRELPIEIQIAFKLECQNFCFDTYLMTHFCHFVLGDKISRTVRFSKLFPGSSPFMPWQQGRRQHCIYTRGTLRKQFTKSTVRGILYLVVYCISLGWL